MTAVASLQERWPVLAAVPPALAWLGLRADLGLADHTIVGLTKALDRTVADGHADAVSDEALAALSPYQTEHINRFGNYMLDLSQPPAPLPFTLPVRSRPPRQDVSPKAPV